MIGQEKIISRINAYDNYEFPHSVLLIGAKGCGKHTLANEISKKLKLKLLDISNELEAETLDKICASGYKKCYLIDIDSITEKQQNTILKFVEEPPENVYIILVSSYKELVLPTILNRCVVFEFEEYTKEQLTQLVVDKDYTDLLIEYCDTPYLVINTKGETLKSLVNLTKAIVEKIGVATYFDSLNIANKLNYKDEYDKYDLLLFFNCLEKEVLSKLFYSVENKTINYYSKMYTLINEYANDCKNTRFDRKRLVENFLSNLWVYVKKSRIV